MNKILLPAQFDNYRNRKDKSVTIQFVTGEISPQEIANIHGLIDQFGYLYWRPEATGMMSKAEMDELDSLEADLYDNPKTQSQRLRGVLYRLWQNKPEGFSDFKQYYKWKTDRIIQHLKDQIDQ